MPERSSNRLGSTTATRTTDARGRSEVDVQVSQAKLPPVHRLDTEEKLIEADVMMCEVEETAFAKRGGVCPGNQTGLFTISRLATCTPPHCLDCHSLCNSRYGGLGCSQDGGTRNIKNIPTLFLNGGLPRSISLCCKETPRPLAALHARRYCIVCCDLSSVNAKRQLQHSLALLCCERRLWLLLYAC